MFESVFPLVGMVIGMFAGLFVASIAWKMIAPFVMHQIKAGRVRAAIASPAGRVMIAALVVAAFVAATPIATFAQTAEPSVQIDFGADDLGIFFDWFNTIFAALLPIALLGAGLTAGGLFVWVIARMLIRAFSNMLGGGQG